MSKYLVLSLAVLMSGLLLIGCALPGGDGDARTQDSDGDGFTDRDEIDALPGSDPFNPEDTPDDPIDTDNDGCSDYDELNFDGFCDNDPFSDGTAPDPDASHIFTVTVARHVDRPLTEEEVDAIFDEGGMLLQTVQTECPDLAADVTFQRNGVVATFDVVPAVITSEAQLDALFAEPYDFKVTQAMIGVCGITTPDDRTMILGCAAPGESVVIVADAAPDVWVHEWGHVQGLPHRDDCPRNIMHSFELATNAINTPERNAYLSPTPSLEALKIGVTPEEFPGLSRLVRSADEPFPDWLRRVVSQTYPAGIPGWAARGLERDAPAHLLNMLNETNFPGPRRNIVRSLGFCGDATVCAQLVGLIDNAEGDLSLDRLGTLAEAFLALGRLVPVDDSGEALEYLIAGTDPAAWSEKARRLTFGPYEGGAMADLLARFAIQGLSVSGNPKATAYLLRSRQDGTLPAQLGDEIDEGIALLGGTSSPAARRALPLRQP